MFSMKILSALVVSLFLTLGSTHAEAANPCTGGNPCAKNACNPCANSVVASNPCAKNACNPCAKNACNPCAKNACNPCAKNACNPCANNACNPCGSSKPIRSKHIKDHAQLVSMGKALWNKDTLGTSGFSCMTCHEDHEKLNIDRHNGSWPHYVHMSKDIVTLDQMINFCMINPMEGKQLDPNGIEMTAMSAYYAEYIRSFKPGAANPCAKNACNPCGK